MNDGTALAAIEPHFTPVFVEKDDEADLIAQYGIDYYPAFVWTDGDGEELLRTVQPETPQELIDALESAQEELIAAASDE